MAHRAITSSTPTSKNENCAHAGWHADASGSWLAALAAARVPLRELRLCDGAVVPGAPAVNGSQPITSVLCVVGIWYTRHQVAC
jgi:hypothetical protein